MMRANNGDGWLIGAGAGRTGGAVGGDQRAEGSDEKQVAAVQQRLEQDYELRILMALRKISHAVDSYSRKLSAQFDMTGPQLMCLYSVVKEGPVTLKRLSELVSLSASTTLGIVDRLEGKGFVKRQRSLRDRRQVLISGTEAGAEFVEHCPSILQDNLAEAVKGLPVEEQERLTGTLERIVELME